jgi:hypothetical protein
VSKVPFAFLYRLARACSRVRRFDAKERAIVYADTGEAEVSGGPCSEAEDDNKTKPQAIPSALCSPTSHPTTLGDVWIGESRTLESALDAATRFEFGEWYVSKTQGGWVVLGPGAHHGGFFSTLEKALNVARARAAGGEK